MKPLFDADDLVAAWMFARSGCRPMQYDIAVGLVDDKGQIVGGAMFSAFNGSDVELHFYGPGQLTRRVVRLVMQIAAHLGVNRMTVRTRKQHMSRGVVKLGAVYEGTIRRLYGPTDDECHAGVQFAFFRETILKLANMEITDHVRRS
jgi:hypothetical protein